MFERRAVTMRTPLLLAVLLSAPFVATAAPTFRLSNDSTVLGTAPNAPGQAYGIEHFQGIYDTDGDGPNLAYVVRFDDIAWSSDNLAVAQVSGTGYVVAFSAGTATLTGTYLGLSDTLTVIVSGELRSYSVTTPDTLVRRYLVYLPPGYVDGTPIPVVLDFHGGGGNAYFEMHASQFNAAARANNFAVVYLNGTREPILDTFPVATANPPYDVYRTWNGGLCCGYASDNDIDDVTYTRMVLDDLATKITVDTERVYATGLSNGALMTHRVACELADRIAAVAPVAGGLDLGGDFPACTPVRPVPMIMFHGTTDANYPYLGGIGPDGTVGVAHHPIPDTLRDWLSINGLSAVAGEVTYQSGIVTCTTHDSRLSNVDVTICLADPATPVKNSTGTVLDGGGHHTPGGAVDAYPGADLPTTDISVGTAMWNFFRNYTLSSTSVISGHGGTNPVAYPNPYVGSRGHSVVSLIRLPPDSEIRIHTLSGALVRELRANSSGAADWDVRNAGGRPVASGIYFVTIKSGDRTDVIKVGVQR